MAHIIERVKAINPEVKVAYHTDGCVYAVIPRADRDRARRAQPGPARRHGPGAG